MCVISTLVETFGVFIHSDIFNYIQIENRVFRIILFSFAASFWFVFGFESNQIILTGDEIYLKHTELYTQNHRFFRCAHSTIQHTDNLCFIRAALKI